MHGTQLKALQNCRLPEHEEEFEAVEEELRAMRGALRVRVLARLLAAGCWLAYAAKPQV